MLAAGAGQPGWPVTGYLQFTKSKDFGITEVAKGDFNELGKTFGKVDISGKLRVSYRNTSATTIEVGSIEISGSFDDVYDFSYWPAGSQAQTASLVQAGHATLGTATASSGKVFFTRLYFTLAFGDRAVHQTTYTK